jgi:hypothetical protein
LSNFFYLCEKFNYITIVISILQYNVCGQNSTQNQEESLGGIENPVSSINLDSITLPKQEMP